MMILDKPIKDFASSLVSDVILIYTRFLELAFKPALVKAYFCVVSSAKDLYIATVMDL